jgi:lysophospholipase L1-like esterase
VKIRYPETGEYLTVAEAAARKRPDLLVLTFGLNGAPATLRRGADAYKTLYRSLIDALQAASPETTIVLQSCFPVAENMDMSRYSLTLDELNEGIRTINAWTLALAEEYGLPYLDTAELLTDEDGRLHLRYQNGDGHHLTRDAYLDVLTYIRTHGIESEETE